MASTLPFRFTGSRIDHCNALSMVHATRLLIDYSWYKIDLHEVICNISIWKWHNSGLISIALIKKIHLLLIRSCIEFNVVIGCQGISSRNTKLHCVESATVYTITDASFFQPWSADSSNIKLSSRRFSASAPSLWNKLPALVSAAESVSSFKSHSKMHLYHQPFMWL